MHLMIRNNIRRSCDGSRIIGYFPTWRNSASLFPDGFYHCYSVVGVSCLCVSPAVTLAARRCPSDILATLREPVFTVLRDRFPADACDETLCTWSSTTPADDPETLIHGLNHRREPLLPQPQDRPERDHAN